MVELIKQGDVDGHNLLYAKYSAILYGAIHAIIKDAKQADIALKQTFNDICKQIHQYDPANGSFLTWTLQVARKVSINYISTAKLPEKVAFGTGKSSISNTELVLIPGGEPTEHEIFAMVLNGCKAHDVAEKLNLPLETVKVNIRKAMQTKAGRS